MFGDKPVNWCTAYLCRTGSVCQAMAGEGEIVHRFETGEKGAAPLPKEFVFGESLLFSTEPPGSWET